MDENKILIRLPAEVWEDKASGAYVSHIPKLGLWSAGNDENEAVKAIGSAVDLYLSVAGKKGTLGNVLLDSGILDTGEKKEPLTLVSGAVTMGRLVPRTINLINTPLEVGLSH